MAPRAFGALFALVAALLFALALAGGLAPRSVPGWWDGHPIVEGKVRDLQALHVGLLDSYGCQLGGGERCQEVPTFHTLEPVSYIELGALGLAILSCLLLAVSAWKVGDRRRFLGTVVLVEAIVIGGCAVALFFLRGPDLDVPMRVGIPVGLGMIAAFAGAGLGFLAAVIAPRLQPEPLRLKSSDPRIPQQAPHQQQPAFDVRELLHNTPAPSGRPHSPGGPLAGPAGPLGGPMHPMHPPPQLNPQPLFETAPQLRPLYDLHNAGASPNPLAPQLPTRAPTPLGAAQVRNILGIPTPPPLEAVTPATHGPFPDAPGPGDSASAHVPVAFGEPIGYGVDPYARPIDRTEDLPLQRDSHDLMPPAADLAAFSPAAPGQFGVPAKTQLGAQAYRAAPPPPPFENAPTTPRTGAPAPDQAGPRHARPGTNVRKAAAAVGGPIRSARPSVPAPSARKHATISAPVPPMPSGIAEPAEPNTSVEIEAALEIDPTDESVIGPPPARPEHRTDESAQFAREQATDENVVAPAPESFEELETRDAKKFSEEELAHAHTELAPRYMPAPNGKPAEVAPAPPPARPSRTTAPPPLPAAAAVPVASFAIAPGGPRASSSRGTASTEIPTAFGKPGARTVAPVSGTIGEPRETTTTPGGATTRRDVAPAGGDAVEGPTALGGATTRKDVERASSELPTELPARKRASSEAPTAHKSEAPPAWKASDAEDEVPTAFKKSDEQPTAFANEKKPAPLPRGMKPSVPPPGKLPAFSMPRIAPAPSSPGSAPRPASTTAPAPFGTIPSPFATKPKVESPAPPRASSEGVTAHAPGSNGAAPAAPPAPAPITKWRDANEAPTRAVGSTPKPALEGPTRAVGGTKTDVPISTAPTSLPPPKKAAPVTSGPTPACPQCEAPMTWVEEHLRFYCASCRMYF
ncbi:MAG: hypothetical protein ABI678_04800 [Kofleriaceae bacterium]